VCLVASFSFFLRNSNEDSLPRIYARSKRYLTRLLVRPNLAPMRIFAVTLAFLCSASAQATHEIIPTSLNGPSCPEIVDAAISKLEPTITLQRMRHRFARAFSFSSDGNFATIHHSSYPDKESVTLRSLKTGEALTSFVWVGPNGNLHDISSVAFDGASKRVVGLTENSFSDGSDVIVSWDGRNGAIEESVVIPATTKFFPVLTRAESHSLHTDISLDHPYYIRSSLRSVRTQGGEYTKELGVQLVDWKNKGMFQIQDASPNFLTRIREPLNTRFGYAAILKSDQTRIELQSFQTIEKHLKPSANKFIEHIDQIGRVFRSNQSTADFSASLKHKTEVEEVLLSTTSPILVARTNSGLHVWNAKTGAPLFEVHAQVRQFRILEEMGVLAYTDGAGNLGLYSLELAKELRVFPGFEPYYLSSNLVTSAAHSAFITLKDGSVVEVTKSSTPGTGTPEFGFVDSNIRLIRHNKSIFTAAHTKAGRYLVHTYQLNNNRGTFQLDVYSLEGDGKPLRSMTYTTSASQPQIELDPTGQRILYTFDDESTGMISLGRLLSELGL
jgi:hypothetical protein